MCATEDSSRVERSFPASIVSRSTAEMELDGGEIGLTELAESPFTSTRDHSSPFHHHHSAPLSPCCIAYPLALNIHQH